MLFYCNIYMKNIEKKAYWILLVIFIISIIMHWFIFKTELQGVHVWRQSETTINIQNFYRYDNNIFNPRVNTFNDGPNNIQRMEFPIMQWVIANVERVFGEHIWVVRICVFIIGLFSILGMFRLSQQLFKSTLVALVVAWAFSFAPIFYYYIVNPMPDNLALCAIIWCLYYFFRHIEDRNTKDLVFSAFFLSLSGLAKLPFLMYGSLIGTYFLWVLFQNWEQNIRYFVRGVAIYSLFLLPALAWYVWVMPTWHENGVLTGIFAHPISKQKALDILEYHWKIMLPKLLLNYATVPLFWIGMASIFLTKAYKKPKFMYFAIGGLTVLAYFLLELNMIDIIHDYYMLPFLPFLFVLVGYGVVQLLKMKQIGIGIIAVLALSMPYFAFKAVEHSWQPANDVDINLYIHRDELRNIVPREEKCIFLNDVSTYIFSYQIDKQGYCFVNDNLPADWIEDMITKKNVHYMYSNSRVVDDAAAVKTYIDTLILQCGTIKVFKLKSKEKLSLTK